MLRLPDEAALQRLGGTIRTHKIEPDKTARGKYYNIRITTDDGVFDSKKEFERWGKLKLLEKAGKVKNLQRQVKFELVPRQTIMGRKHRPITYIADFVYTEFGRRVVEDVKGFRTRLYQLKRRLMKLRHDIEVLET